MTGEIVSFRKKFIGGFNRDDVTAYITKITKERNESLKAKDKAEREVLVLRGEMNREKEKSAEEAQVLIHEHRLAKEKAENDASMLLIQKNEMQSKLDEMQERINELQRKAYEPVEEIEVAEHAEPNEPVEPVKYIEHAPLAVEDEISAKLEEMDAFSQPAPKRLVIKVNKKSERSGD